ncbi:MAG: hypothetical protein INR71_11030, partial [Terriglobus roseus]|nr:hypothetical protein [Terriglobus roseus]
MSEAERLQQQIDFWQGLFAADTRTRAAADAFADKIQEHFDQQEAGGGHYSHGSWAPRRGSPYGVRRGGRYPRAGRASYRNRTLVAPTPTAAGADGAVDSAPSSSGRFFATTGRHMQLINSTIYDRVTQQKQEDVQKALAARRQHRAAEEAARLKSFFAGAGSHAHSQTQLHDIDVNGVQFRVADGGSKLIKSSSHPAALVPKRASVGGVTFFRSKNGNLYRAGIVKPKQWVEGERGATAVLTSGRSKLKKSSERCATFSTTGISTFAPPLSKEPAPASPQERERER